MKKLLIPWIIVLAWMASAKPREVVKAPSLDPAAPASHDTLVIPVAGVQRGEIRDTFNDGRAGHIHGALDIMAPRGTPVVAAVDGSIRKLFTSRLGGLTIYEFDESGTRCYYYAHLDRYAPIVEGQKVHRGDVIGFVGSTGNASTPHLHFAVAVLPPTKEWWKGEVVNPYRDLVDRGITKPVAELPATPSGAR